MRMKRCAGNFLALLITMVACALNASAQQSPAVNTKAGDEAAIRENIKYMQDGWNMKNSALYAKPFAADADFVIMNGMQYKGREAIAKGHQQIFDTIFKDSTLNAAVKQLRFLRPDIALAHVAGHIKARQGEETREFDLSVTLLLAKDQGEWKIAAFQNTRIMPNPQR